MSDSRINTAVSIKQEPTEVADHIPGSPYVVINLCSGNEETAVEADAIVQTEAMSPSTIHTFLTKKSIIECTNLICDFIEKKEDERHFGRCLFQELWACLSNQQQYDVDPERWYWGCISRKSRKLQNECGYRTSKQGSEKYFPTPEGVVRFVSKLINRAYDKAFKGVKEKFEEFQLRLSRAIEKNLDFDSAGGEKRKRKMLDIGNSREGAKKARTSSTKDNISPKQKTNNYVGEEKLVDYLLRNFVKKDLKGAWCCRKTKCSFKRKQTAGPLNTTKWSEHIIYDCEHATPSKVQELKEKYKENRVMKKVLSKKFGAKKDTNLNQSLLVTFIDETSTNNSNEQKECSETSGDDDSSYTPPGGRSYTKHRDIFLDSSTCSSCTSREEDTIEPVKYSITFDLNGERVGVPKSIITKHPHSKIAKLAKKEKEPVYLDCDHNIFGQALNFLRDGKVKLPLNVSKGALIEYLHNLFNIEDIDENKIEQDVVQMRGMSALSIAYHAEVIHKQHFIWKMVADCTKHLLDKELLKISDTFTIDLSDYDVEYKENVASLCSNKKKTIEECNDYLSKVGLRLENITTDSLKLKKLAGER